MLPKKIKEISLRHKIGLHQSFQASENSKLMKVEKSLLDKIFNIKQNAADSIGLIFLLKILGRLNINLVLCLILHWI